MNKSIPIFFLQFYLCHGPYHKFETEKVYAINFAVFQ